MRICVVVPMHILRFVEQTEIYIIYNPKFAVTASQLYCSWMNTGIKKERQRRSKIDFAAALRGDGFISGIETLKESASFLPEMNVIRLFVESFGAGRSDPVEAASVLAFVIMVGDRSAFEEPGWISWSMRKTDPDLATLAPPDFIQAVYADRFHPIYGMRMVELRRADSAMAKAFDKWMAVEGNVIPESLGLLMHREAAAAKVHLMQSSAILKRLHSSMQSVNIRKNRI